MLILFDNEMKCISQCPASLVLLSAIKSSRRQPHKFIAPVLPTYQFFIWFRIAAGQSWAITESFPLYKISNRPCVIFLVQEITFWQIPKLWIDFLKNLNTLLICLGMYSSKLRHFTRSHFKLFVELWEH